VLTSRKGGGATYTHPHALLFIVLAADEWGWDMWEAFGERRMRLVYVPIDRTVIGVLDPPFFHVFMLKNPSAIRITPEPPPIMSDFMLPAVGSRREQAFKQMQAAGDAARRLHVLPLPHQRVR